MLSGGAAVRRVKRTNLPGPNGGTTDVERVAAMSPDIVTFNGRAFQYPPPSIWGRGKGSASGVLTLVRKGRPRHPTGVLRWSIGIRCSNQMLAKFRGRFDP